MTAAMPLPPLSATKSHRPASREKTPLKAVPLKPSSSAGSAAPAVAEEKPPPEASVPEGDHCIMRTAAAIRTTPTFDGMVQRVMTKGTVLTVFGRQGAWLQVGEVEPWGWIHSSLLIVIP
jgi:hypothetical protein